MPSVGRLGGIIIIWDPKVLELVDSRIFLCATSSNRCFDSYVWGLIEVYSSNEGNVKSDLFEELVTFMSNCDIPWCLGGDFSVVRFPSERSTGGRLTSAMIEFSGFIDS